MGRAISGIIAAAALGLALPADAALMFSASVGGVEVLHCVDGQGSTALCPGGDQNAAPGVLQLANNTFAGVELNGSLSSSQGNPGNPALPAILNTGSLSIINTGAGIAHIVAAVGDTDFFAPAGHFDFSTSGVFQLAEGSTISTTAFDDAVNRQGAQNSTDVVGAPISTFNFTASLPADAFAHSDAGPVFDTDPYSMTQLIDLSLTAGGQLVGRQSTEIKTVIPAPGNSLVLLGLALLGFGLWFSTRGLARGNHYWG
jgi:hypothetical protein